MESCLTTSKISNTEQIFENAGTSSYIDKMQEEVRHKPLKEKLLDNIKIDTKTYITEFEINEKIILEMTVLTDWKDAIESGMMQGLDIVT